MKLSEGYAIVILERVEHAHARHAEPMARVAGFGESCDAFHLSKPHPEGEGAAKAMHRALGSAQLAPEDIDMLVAHATATPDNDASEHAALAQVFGKHLSNTPVVGFKSHLGHSLGAAGAVDLILSALAIRDQEVPPCANISNGDTEFSDLHVTCGESVKRPLQYTLNTSLGFGGANSCVILAQPNVAIKRHASTVTPNGNNANKLSHDVAITGLGIVLPDAIGNEAFTQRVNKTNGQPYANHNGTIPSEKYEHLINARRTRRMSEYAKLCLAATTEAYRDANIQDIPGFGENCAALVATTHAAAQYCESFYQQLIDEGINAVNPTLFAEGVPNVASAHLSTNFAIKGFCQTLIGTRTAGLEALLLATARIRSGCWNQAVVVAAEEATDLVTQSYRHHFTKHTGDNNDSEFSYASGAVAIILERRDLAEKRHATIRATIAKTVAAFSTNQTAKARMRTAIQTVKQLGDFDTLLPSGNGQHLDRIDAAVVRRFSSHACHRPIAGASPTERFSVGPLASLAAAIIGKIPCAGVVCSDHYGSIYAAKIHVTAE